MSNSALGRLLSIAAIANATKETSPEDAAGFAEKEQLSAINPPEMKTELTDDELGKEFQE